MQVDSPTGLSAALACAIVPATSVLTGILLLATHLMEKMSMTGAPPGPLIWGPDAIMGALFGAGTFVYTGYVMPWLAHCLKRPFKVGVCSMYWPDLQYGFGIDAEEAFDCACIPCFDHDADFITIRTPYLPLLLPRLPLLLLTLLLLLLTLLLLLLATCFAVISHETFDVVLPC